MSTGVAKDTLAVCEAGAYVAPSGKTVTLGTAVEDAIRGTILYTPAALDALLEELASRARPGDAPTSASPRIEVTGETSGGAGQRLVAHEGEPRVVALNFASAKNPGGGFLRGAKAQEEDLARASALYPCLVAQRAYYDVNRAEPTFLYTDHIIYSPDVPFFRDERLALLEQPFPLSILTAPAPNAGEALKRDAGAASRIGPCIAARARKVLAIAAARQHRCLLLGAWGCGVFRNDPAVVADAFALALGDPASRGAFDRVVFAVYDRSRGQENRRAFEARFG